MHRTQNWNRFKLTKQRTLERSRAASCFCLWCDTTLKHVWNILNINEQLWSFIMIFGRPTCFSSRFSTKKIAGWQRTLALLWSRPSCCTRRPLGLEVVAGRCKWIGPQWRRFLAGSWESDHETSFKVFMSESEVSSRNDVQSKRNWGPDHHPHVWLCVPWAAAFFTNNSAAAFFRRLRCTATSIPLLGPDAFRVENMAASWTQSVGAPGWAKETKNHTVSVKWL